MKTKPNFQELESIASDSTITLPANQNILNAITAESDNYLPQQTKVALTDKESNVKDIQTIETETYEHAAIVEQLDHEYSQTIYTIPSTICLSDVISEPEINKQYFDAMQQMLHPIVSCYDDDDEDIEIIRTLPKTKIERCPIDDILNLSPFVGTLDPFECQIISIAFQPRPDTSVKVDAVCHVYGGATEVISIEGVTADVGYELSTDYVEFGRQVTLV